MDICTLCCLQNQASSRFQGKTLGRISRIASLFLYRTIFKMREVELLAFQAITVRQHAKWYRVNHRQVI